MKRILGISLLLVFITASLFSKEIRLLTIGNSFAESALKFLPQIAESAPDCKLIYIKANHPGCELSRHWRYIQEEDGVIAPEPKFDKDGKDITPKDIIRYGGGKSKLKDLLKSDKWDIVTIQQASTFSWQNDSYFPYAKEIYDYVKKYSPQAEVVFQQTWAYRIDEPRLKKWEITQQEMYEKLTQAYNDAAKKLKVRQIPTGYAVQLFREKSAKKFVEYTEDEIKNLTPPNVLPLAIDPAGFMSWKKDKNGKLYLSKDAFHLNDRGAYLQGCLWFAFLFNEPTSKIKFAPDALSKDEAKFVREIAQKALDTFKQAN